MTETGEAPAVDEQRVINGVSVGYRFCLLMVAYAKHHLAGDVPDATRLQLLENINGAMDSYLNRDRLAKVEAMTADECRMVEEALALDKGAKKNRAPHGYDLLVSNDVFSLLLRPLRAAIGL